MPDFLFPPPIVAVPIKGSDKAFPVGRIFCVGRNYAAHAAEMGGDTRTPPFFFMKPAGAVRPLPDAIAYPPDTAMLHHEVELVVALGEGGAPIAYGVGVDLTKRDRQAQAKEAGGPWERAKAFEESAPLSALALASAIGHPTHARISLFVNEAKRQESDIAQMIWSVPEILAELAKVWTPRAGDLVFTGTPEGVGPLERGDIVRADIAGVGAFSFRIS